MKQTNATFLVENGVLMADQDQCISLANARVIVEPIDLPSTHPETVNAQIVKDANEAFQRMDRAASRLMKWFIVIAAFYLLGEVVHAFASGAFAAAVR